MVKSHEHILFSSNQRVAAKEINANVPKMRNSTATTCHQN